MFKYPATEIFNPRGERAVVWSEEEHAAAIAGGWSETLPAPPVEFDYPGVPEPTVEADPELIQEPVLQPKRRR